MLGLRSHPWPNFLGPFPFSFVSPPPPRPICAAQDMWLIYQELLLKKAVSVTQHLTVACISKARGGILCPTLFSMLGFSLVWACTGFDMLLQMLPVHTYKCPALSRRHC